MFSLLQNATVTVVETQPPAASVGGADNVVVVDDAADVVVTAADTTVATGTPVLVETTGTEVGAVHAVGMPQLDVSTFGNQIFWLLIALAVLYWALSKIALPRIGAVISDRQGAITGDLMQAEDYKKKARDAEAAYDRALAEARGEAGKIVASQKAEIQKDLDAAIMRADADIASRTAESEKRIGAIRASSAADTRSVARDVTAEVLRKFGGRVDDDAIDKAVDAQLQGVA